MSWKLTASHLIVTLISTFIFGFGVYLVFVIGVASGSGVNSVADFIYGTVLIAIVGGVYLALIGAVGAVISGIAGIRLARRFGRRIEAIEEATEEIARGNLDHRVAIVSRDELGRLAERFNLLASRLEVIESGRRTFVSNVSHDLRTPIAVIRGHVEAQLARDEGAEPAAPVE
ncbi:MAG: HAMP domain-containing protein, partial [Thermomicrobiales bacterium]